LNYDIRFVCHDNQELSEKNIKPIIKSMNGCSVESQLHPNIKIGTAVAYPD